jgi:hypothetical protein
MIAIYSFKRFKHHYKALDQTFIRLAKYSVECASKWYKTKLYSDSKSREMFDSYEIYFDEYEVLDEIEEYKGISYCMPKLYAMMAESDPYILFDFDSIVYEKLNFPESITYAYPEVDLRQGAPTSAIKYTLEHYIKPFELIPENKFHSEIETDWSIIPNHSLIAVKNPELVKGIYSKILDLLTEEEIEILPPMLVEQYLLYRYLVKNKIKVGYVNERMPKGIEHKVSGSHKFYHFCNYDKKIPESNYINSFLKDYYKLKTNFFVTLH